MSKPGKHTIILIQFTGTFDSRTYLDFATVSAACDGI